MPTDKPRFWGRRLALVVAALLVLPLLATAWRERRRPPPPPQTQIAIIAGDTLTYHTWGPDTGAVVLLVHGMATWGHVWRPVAETLAQRGWRAVAVDLPPFGWSTRLPRGGVSAPRQAARLAGVLDLVSPNRPAVVVAHSIGAEPVLALAITRPARIARLAWVSPALGLDAPVPAGPPALAARLLGVRAFRDWALSTAALWPGGARAALQANYGTATPPPSDADVALLTTPFAVPGSVRAWGAWAAEALAAPTVPLERRRAAAATLTAPMLLIWGDADPVTPLAQRATLLRLWPQRDTLTYAGVGHFPPTEAPARLAKDLAAWLGTSGQPAAAR